MSHMFENAHNNRTQCLYFDDWKAFGKQLLEFPVSVSSFFGTQLSNLGYKFITKFLQKK